MPQLLRNVAKAFAERKVERNKRMRNRIERKFSVPFSIWFPPQLPPSPSSPPLKFKGHQNRSAVLKLFRVKIILHSARVFLALFAGFLLPHALQPPRSFTSSSTTSGYGEGILVVLSLCVAHDFFLSPPFFPFTWLCCWEDEFRTVISSAKSNFRILQVKDDFVHQNGRPSGPRERGEKLTFHLTLGWASYCASLPQSPKRSSRTTSAVI